MQRAGRQPTSMVSGDGPTKAMPSSSQRRANVAFSDRKPYPGWIASAPMSLQIIPKTPLLPPFHVSAECSLRFAADCARTDDCMTCCMHVTARTDDSATSPHASPCAHRVHPKQVHSLPGQHSDVHAAMGEGGALGEREDGLDVEVAGNGLHVGRADLVALVRLVAVRLQPVRRAVDRQLQAHSACQGCVAVVCMSVTLAPLVRTDVLLPGFLNHHALIVLLGSPPAVASVIPPDMLQCPQQRMSERHALHALEGSSQICIPSDTHPWKTCPGTSNSEDQEAMACRDPPCAGPAPCRRGIPARQSHLGWRTGSS